MYNLKGDMTECITAALSQVSSSETFFTTESLTKVARVREGGLMRSNGYTFQIACCASCTPRKENFPFPPPRAGWVGTSKESPPLPFWLQRAPSPKVSDD